MLKLYWARFLFRINDRHFRFFLAVHVQRINPYWMANRRELRDHGAFFWIVLPSRRFYREMESPYMPG